MVIVLVLAPAESPAPQSIPHTIFVKMEQTCNISHNNNKKASVANYSVLDKLNSIMELVLEMLPIDGDQWDNRGTIVKRGT